MNEWTYIETNWVTSHGLVQPSKPTHGDGASDFNFIFPNSTVERYLSNIDCTEFHRLSSYRRWDSTQLLQTEDLSPERDAPRACQPSIWNMDPQSDTFSRNPFHVQTDSGGSVQATVFPFQSHVAAVGCRPWSLTMGALPYSSQSWCNPVTRYPQAIRVNHTNRFWRWVEKGSSASSAQQAVSSLCRSKIRYLKVVVLRTTVGLCLRLLGGKHKNVGGFNIAVDVALSVHVPQSFKNHVRVSHDIRLRQGSPILGDEILEGTSGREQTPITSGK